MRLLLLTDGIMPFTVGGMQKHSQQLAKNLAMLGHQITLVHCIYGGKKLPTTEEIASVFGDIAMKNLEVITLRFPKRSWFPGHYLYESYGYSKSIYNQLKSRIHEYDFIYTKGFAGWYFLEQKTKHAAMPPIGVKFHGYEMFQKPANFKMWLQNKLLQKPVLWNNEHADFIFSYGGGITDLLMKIGLKKEKIIDIPTGIDSSWCATRPMRSTGEQIQFCFVGRYERRKGIEEIHEALKSLGANTFLHFHFVGPIPPAQRIKSNTVTYHESITDSQKMIALLDDCDILVAPSHSEGMPNVIMEAMARGMAVLTTRVGAIESVVSQDNGWFVEPGNSVDLANRMSEIISTNRHAIDQKKEASAQRIAAYTWDRIAAITAGQIAAKLNE